MAAQINNETPVVNVANLMTVIGREAQIICKSFALMEEERKEIKVLKPKFIEYLTPMANMAYKRYRFNKMSKGGSFIDFPTAARLQAKKRKFGDITNALLQHRPVVGITSGNARENMLADPAIYLQKTIHMCKSTERSTQQPKEITTKNKTAKLLDAKPRQKSGCQKEKLRHKNHSTHSTSTVGEPISGKRLQPTARNAPPATKRETLERFAHREKRRKSTLLNMRTPRNRSSFEK